MQISLIELLSQAVSGKQTTKGVGAPNIQKGADNRGEQGDSPPMPVDFHQLLTDAAKTSEALENADFTAVAPLPSPPVDRSLRHKDGQLAEAEQVPPLSETRAVNGLPLRQAPVMPVTLTDDASVPPIKSNIMKQDQPESPGATPAQFGGENRIGIGVFAGSEPGSAAISHPRMFEGFQPESASAAHPAPVYQPNPDNGTSTDLSRSAQIEKHRAPPEESAERAGNPSGTSAREVKGASVREPLGAADPAALLRPDETRVNSPLTRKAEVSGQTLQGRGKPPERQLPHAELSTASVPRPERSQLSGLQNDDAASKTPPDRAENQVDWNSRLPISAVAEPVRSPTETQPGRTLSTPESAAGLGLQISPGGEPTEGLTVESHDPGGLRPVDGRPMTTSVMATATGAASVDRAQQVVVQISRGLAEQGKQEIQLTLDPPELGRVQIRFVGDEANMTAMLMVERPEIFELLRRHLHLLDQEFRQIFGGDVSLEFADRDQQWSDASPADMNFPDSARPPQQEAGSTKSATLSAALRLKGAGVDIRL